MCEREEENEMKKDRKVRNCGSVSAYVGIGRNRGMAVDSEEALCAALEYCGVMPHTDKPIHPGFAEMVVEWAFSGDWVEG